MSLDLAKRPEIIAVLQEMQNEKQKSLLKMIKKKRQQRQKKRE
jgi:hypothetical protein